MFVVLMEEIMKSTLFYSVDGGSRFPETLVPSYETALRHISGNSNLQQLRTLYDGTTRISTHVSN
jgi:hypothetical protein